MKYKYLNDYKANEFSTLFCLKKEIPQNNLENISSEEKLKNSKISHQNFNKAFITGLNEIINETNATNWNMICDDKFGISKIQFSLIGENSKKQIKKENLKDTKTKPGRKRKREDINSDLNTNENDFHDKFSDDNLRKRCKNLVLKNVFKFINEKIREKYKNNLGHGKFKKELKNLSQKNKVNSTVTAEKSFLIKTLKDIFSEDISSKYTDFPKTFNKLLIESLIKDDNNEERKKFFIKLFNISFLDCLKYFREDKKAFIEELNGFTTISEIKNMIISKNGVEYFDIFIDYLQTFEEKINTKKARKRRNKIEDKIVVN